MSNTNDVLREALIKEYKDGTAAKDWPAWAADAFTYLSQPANAGKGWKLLPVEPTLGMLDALRADTTSNLLERYRAMLAAVPAAPQADELRSQRDELADLLEEAEEYTRHPDYDWHVEFSKRVRAAIAKVRGS